MVAFLFCGEQRIGQSDHCVVNSLGRSFLEDLIAAFSLACFSAHLKGFLADFFPVHRPEYRSYLELLKLEIKNDTLNRQSKPYLQLNGALPCPYYRMPVGFEALHYVK